MSYSIYVTRVIPQEGIDLLQGHDNFEVEVNTEDRQLSASELRDRAATSDALITLLTDPIHRDVLQAGAGKLRIVANVAVGYDNIDLDAATDANILVANTPGVLTETTADFAWALLMATARRIPEGDKYLRSGQFHGWGIMMLLGQDIYGKTLGIAGFGRIGQALARRARGFNMRILYYDPVATVGADLEQELGVSRVDLQTLLRESDHISVHTPLTEETRHLFGEHQFAQMKPTACLINTARGPVVDERALARALRAGTLAGAGLDVFEDEPAVHPELLELDNVVLTPHIASASVATRTRMATMAAENVIAALEGRRPSSALNVEILDR